jgi:hypothetical protein
MSDKPLTAKQMLRKLESEKIDNIRGLKMTVDGKPITGVTLNEETGELQIETGKVEKPEHLKPPTASRAGTIPPPPLPEFLGITPEKVMDAKEAQRQIYAAMGPPSINPQIRETRAAVGEQVIRANLALMQPGQDGYEQTRKMLAETLIEQGKFEDADEYDDSYKLSERCDCPPDTATSQIQTARGPETRTVEVPTEFVVKEAGGRKLVRCAKCNAMWVGDAAPAELAIIEQNRNEKFA